MLIIPTEVEKNSLKNSKSSEVGDIAALTVAPKLEFWLIDKISNIRSRWYTPCSTTIWIHKLMIWMDPEGQIGPNGLDKSQFLFGTLLDEAYQYRIVSTREEMVEKILVFDSDLDDKPLEMLKYYIRETHLGKDDDPDETVLYFGGRGNLEDEGKVVFINKLTGPDQKSFRVPIHKYQQIKNEYTDHYPGPMPEAGRWLRVDENYFK